MSQSVAEDIYFTEEYCSLYEPAEQGKTVSFQMDCPFGSVFHLFLKRPIPTPVDGVRYYDATTAYGYGGPVIRALKIPRGSTEGSARQMLLHCFEEKYGAFCKEQRIIAEFVRFHPVL